MVYVEDRHTLEKGPVRVEDWPDALQLPTVSDYDQVVIELGVGLAAEPLHAGEELVHRRHRVRANRSRQSPVSLNEHRDGQRRTQRIGLGVLVADRQHSTAGAEPLYDLVGNGSRVGRQVDIRVAHRGFRLAGGLGL